MKIDHIIGHKNNLNKLFKIKVIQNVFSDHIGIKLEVSNIKKTGKALNSWKLKNALK